MLTQGYRRSAAVWAGSATAWALGTAFEAWVLMVVLGAAHHHFLAGDGYPWGFWACAVIACIRQATAWIAAKVWDAGMAGLLALLTRRLR
jgi:hypothetical protein